MEWLGTALAAIVGIAIWDIVRMVIQTWWLGKILKKNRNVQPNCCCKDYTEPMET